MILDKNLTAKERKEAPVYSGFLCYFPLAVVEVARLSKIGNDQHNPGKPLHWDRSKSGDEHDALMRHLMDAGEIDTDGVRHSTKVAWRAMAALQKELEQAEEDRKWYRRLTRPVRVTVQKLRGVLRKLFRKNSNK